MRKVFLETLPRWGKGGKAKEGTIKWDETIGYKIKGTYEGTAFEVEIIKYQSIGQKLKIKYLEQTFNIHTNNFQKCKLGKLLGVYTSDFKIEIGQIFKGEKRNMTIIDREYRQKERIDKEGNRYFENRKWYKYHCNKCGYEEWIIENSLIGKQASGCLCCRGYIAVEGINSIVDTTPWMIPYFQGGYDEAKLYTQRGGGNPYNPKGYIKPICPDCGRVKDRKISISNIYKNHSIGCSCSDNIPFGEKAIFNILEQLKINFQTQLSKVIFKWCDKYKYDFYFELNNEKYICEVNGNQHYEKAFETCGGRTLKCEQENDEFKKKLALQNGIKEENYIIIDCRKSELKWIKQNILESKMNSIFDLCNIDWLKVWNFTLSSRVKEACEYKRNNPEMTTIEIGDIMKIGKSAIISYLKKGTKLYWCNYDPKEEMVKGRKKSKNGKPIIVFKKQYLYIFISVSELIRQSEELFGVILSSSKISAVCNGKRNQHKGYTFKYIEYLTQEEYIAYDIENKLKELHNQELVQAC